MGPLRRRPNDSVIGGTLVILMPLLLPFFQVQQVSTHKAVSINISLKTMKLENKTIFVTGVNNRAAAKLSLIALLNHQVKKSLCGGAQHSRSIEELAKFNDLAACRTYRSIH